MHPEEIHITYRVVEYPLKHNPSLLRKGVCTTFLSPKQPALNSPLGFIPCFIWKSTFRLPVHAQTPLICIAGGTGIAPFKAFMEERDFLLRESQGTRTRQDWGPFELYYGMRDPTEFAYREEVEQVRRSDEAWGYCVVLVL